MSTKQDRRNLKKRRREHKRAAVRSQYLARKARISRYPKIVVDSTEGNGYFVAEVRKVLRDLDFDDPDMGPDWMRQFYRRCRADGVRSAYLWLEALEQDARRRIVRAGSLPVHEDDYPTTLDINTHLGERIFARIPIETRRRFLPMNDFEVRHDRDTIVLRFSSLLEEPGGWGTVYYSRLVPKIDLDGRRLTVAFSGHAIQQMCARRTPRYLNYSANGDAHTYLAKCIYHEAVTLADGTPAIRLWDICDVDGYRVYRDYVKTVFGESNRKLYGGACHYILGYCPVVHENGFAKAKSFLYPGFRGTPERVILNTGPGQQAEYASWLDDAEAAGAEPFFETPRAIEVAKWLHTHGLPQVVQMTRTVLNP